MSGHSKVLNFESLKFNPFDNSEQILTDESLGLDSNFFNSNIGNFDTPNTLMSYLIINAFIKLESMEKGLGFLFT